MCNSISPVGSTQLKLDCLHKCGLSIRESKVISILCWNLIFTDTAPVDRTTSARNSEIRNLQIAFPLPLLSATAAAQTSSASVVERVTDPAGAVIPGANVKIADFERNSSERWDDYAPKEKPQFSDRRKTGVLRLITKDPDIRLKKQALDCTDYSELSSTSFALLSNSRNSWLVFFAWDLVALQGIEPWFDG